MAKDNQTWDCPICSLTRLPYGESCPRWCTGCEGAKTPNATGAWYLANVEDATAKSAAGVGISKISDEEVT